MGKSETARDAQERAGRAHARFLPSSEGFATISNQFAHGAAVGGAFVDAQTCQKLALDFATLSVAIIAVPTE